MDPTQALKSPVKLESGWWIEEQKSHVCPSDPFINGVGHINPNLESLSWDWVRLVGQVRNFPILEPDSPCFSKQRNEGSSDMKLHDLPI